MAQIISWQDWTAEYPENPFKKGMKVEATNLRGARISGTVIHVCGPMVTVGYEKQFAGHTFYKTHDFNHRLVKKVK